MNQQLYLYQMFPDFENATNSLELSLKPQVTDVERVADPSIYVMGENFEKMDVSDSFIKTNNLVNSTAVPSIHGYLSQHEQDFIVHPYNCVRQVRNMADSTSSLEPQEPLTLFDSLLHQEQKVDSPIKSSLHGTYVGFENSEKKDSFLIDDISLTKLLTRSPQRNNIMKNVSTKSFLVDFVQDNQLSEEQIEFLKLQTDYTFESIDLIGQRKIKDLANIDAQTQNQQYKIYSKLAEFYPFDDEKNDDNIYFGLVSDHMLQQTDNLLLPEDLQGQPEELEQEDFDDFVKQQLNSLNRIDVPIIETEMKESDGYLANQQNRQQKDGEIHYNNELKFHFIGKDYDGQLKNYKLK